MTKSVEERMQLLSRAVLSEAQAEAEQVLEAAQARADTIRDRAQEQAQAEREEILARARRDAERVRSGCVASAQLEARRLRLERREQVLDRVFETVRQRLPNVQGWTDYDQIVRDLTREAVGHLSADAVRIRADARAREVLADSTLFELSEELGVRLRLEELDDGRTGIVAETMDGHRRYDNTLQARLDRWQDALRAPVYRLLMGESL
jgi:V/A-type H+-transporting ATPase subunit E